MGKFCLCFSCVAAQSKNPQARLAYSTTVLTKLDLARSQILAASRVVHRKRTAWEASYNSHSASLGPSKTRTIYSVRREADLVVTSIGNVPASTAFPEKGLQYLCPGTGRLMSYATAIIAVKAYK